MTADKCAYCLQPANQRCGGCHTVMYCCKEHQRVDWKSHKHKCRPFKIGSCAELGRYLEATRPIKPGEILLKEEPLVAGPPQMTPPVCLGCYVTLTPENHVECERCGWPMCSKECTDSPTHRPECHITQNSRREKVKIRNFLMVHPTYQCLTVLRCLHLRESNPDAWAKLWSLESHCKERRHTPQYEADRATVAGFVRHFFNMNGFSDDQVLRVCGIMQVNGHEVPVTDPAHVAVYDVASLLEHSCLPNCSKIFDADGRILIRAAVPIPAGSHLSICYTDPLWGTSNRRHHLRQTKFFWCCCERCSDPTECGSYFSALRCENSSCSGFLLPLHPLAEEEGLDFAHPRMSWRCGVCRTEFSGSRVLERLEAAGRSLSELPKNDPQACESFLKEYGEVLHPDHQYMTTVKLALAQLYGQGLGGLAALTDDQLERKRSLCSQVLQLVTSLVPAEHRARGLMLVEMQGALAEMSRRQVARGELDAWGSKQQLLEFRRMLTETVDLLKYEPSVIPEGKILQQATRNLKEVEYILKTIHTDSPL